MGLLEVNQLSKRFGGLAAVSDVDLMVEQGEVHSVIGPNGAGKSTLLNMLTGNLVPDAGGIVFDGRRITGHRPYAINQLGMARVFQSPEIFPGLTLLENVTIAALAARDGSFRMNALQRPSASRKAIEEAEAALDQVELLEKRHQEAKHLARGDKRRLELALCLAHKPRLLLLDEPTAGMSQKETQSTIELLRRLARDGMTKLIIEHDMKVVFALSDRITVLHQGKVIASGLPEEIREDEVVHDAYLGGVEV